MVSVSYHSTDREKNLYIKNRITEVLGSSDKKVIYIVPEQYTVMSEIWAARTFGASGVLRIEVTNMTRLSASIARKTGNIQYSDDTAGAQMLILYRAAREAMPFLSEGMRQNRGFLTRSVPGLYGAQTQLNAAGYTVEQLSDTAEKIDEANNPLREKVNDLAYILSEAGNIKERVSGKVMDPHVRISEYAKSSGYFDNAVVIFDMFYSMTGRQMEALESIIFSADKTYITIPVEHDADGIQYLGIKRFRERIIEMITKRQYHMVVERSEPDVKYSSSELAVLKDYLWDYTYDISNADRTRYGLPDDKDSVRIISVGDRYSEAETLCCRIAGLIRDGSRYSDIAVICEDVNKLHGVTDIVAKRHGIPLFVSQSVSVSESVAVRFILTLLRIPDRWRPEDLTALMKTGLIPVGEDQAGAFENYISSWRIRGKNGYTANWTNNPEGYFKEISERGKKTLELANTAKDIIVPVLEAFSDRVEKRDITVREYIEAVVNCFIDSGAYSMMRRRAATLEENGYPDDAVRETQVWDQICTSFDLMETIAGDLPADADIFRDLFLFAIHDADTGSIPPGKECVIFSSARSLRAENIKHVIVLGAVEGEFPKTVSSGGYFSDADREELLRFGMDMGDDLELMTSDSLFTFYRAVTTASDSLTVIVPGSSFGTPCVMSSGVERIISLLGTGVEDYTDMPLQEVIYDRESLLEYIRKNSTLESRKALSPLMEELFEKYVPSEIPEYQSISPEFAKLIFEQQLMLTQSRINEYLSCPFSYYADYMLDLNDPLPAEFESVNTGNMVHEVLDRYMKYVKDLGRYPADEEIGPLCRSFADEYIEAEKDDYTDKRNEYLADRIARKAVIYATCMTEELRRSDFRVFSTELRIDGNEQDSPLMPTFETSDGGSVAIRGIIDRLDIYRKDNRTYVRVIDYKTGNKTFSFKELRKGTDVQLVLYLFAVCSSTETEFGRKIMAGTDEIVPAGSLYYSLQTKGKTSDRPLSPEEAEAHVSDTISRNGIVCDDIDVIKAMDRGPDGKFLPVKLNKDGSAAMEKEVQSRQQIEEIFNETIGVVVDTAEDMKSGKASVSPVNREGWMPCEYCKFRAVCKIDGKDMK